MAKSIIHKLQCHPRRHMIVGFVTLGIFLLLGMPVYDEYAMLQNKKADVQDQLGEVELTLSNLEMMRSRLEKLNQASDGEPLTVDPEAALRIREEIISLIRKNNSRLLRATPSEPAIRAWGETDDPFSSTAPSGSDKSRFQLVTTRLNLSVEGNMPNLTRIVKDLSKLHEMIVPTKMHMRRDGNRETLQLDLELTMLHLMQKKA